MIESKLVAACIFPRLDLDKYLNDSNYSKKIHGLVELGIGGFCVFGKLGLKEVKGALSTIQNLSENFLLFTADLEYGLPMRFLEGTAFPHAMALGNTKDITKTFISSQLIAKEAKSVGIHWNFAPVADINSNPRNPIINIRSFGENDEVVSNHVAAYIKGHKEENIINCAKHFPGHGDTQLDSHLTLPSISKSRLDLENFEIKPFVKAIKNGVDSIMLGHLVVASIDEKGIPASLSKTIIDYLKKDLGFGGVVISDALDMKAISEEYGSSDACEMAFRAGNHIALMPEEPDEAISYLSELVSKDDEFKSIIMENIKKINGIKKRVSNNSSELGLEDKFIQHEKIALSIAQSALELNVKKMIIPIEEDKQIAAFAILQNENDFGQASMFYNLLSSALENNMDFGFIDENLKDEDLSGMVEGTKDADIFIFVFFFKSRAWQSEIGVSDKISRIIHKLTMGKDVINIFAGNPYLASSFESDISIKTFSDSLASLASSVLALSGRKLD